MARRKDTTLTDLALETGVSVSTVSRVLNGQGPISEATRSRVLAAAQARGLKPEGSSLPRGPVLAMSLFGQDVDDEDSLEDPFFIRAVAGAGRACFEEGAVLHPVYAAHRDEEESLMLGAADSGRYQGILLSTVYNQDRTIAELRRRGFPHAVIGRPESPQDTLWVDNDNFQAMYDLVNQLVDKGYTRLRYLAGPETYHFSYDRVQGFYQALRSRALAPEPGQVAYWPLDLDAYAGELGPEGVQVVICKDDFLALRLDACLKDGARPVLIGFNNSLVGRWHSPPLPSVETHPFELGYWAAKLLLQQLSGERGPGHRIIPTRLMWRS